MRKKIIFGLGQTGISLANFFKQKGEYFEFVDSRLYPPGLESCQKIFPDVPIHCGEFSVSLYDKADTFYLSPGINPRQTFFDEACARGISIKGDISVFMEAVKAPVVAVTGTNGKSTVTAWLHHIGQCSSEHTILMGGNIGIPALDLLREPVPDLYVLELSSFQLELVEQLPIFAACVMNVTPDHLDRHGTLSEYQTIKHRIYSKAKYCIVNEDDPFSFPKQLSGEKRGFSLKHETNYYLKSLGGHPVLMHGSRALIETDQLSLPGRQNWQNALATVALAELFDIDETAILEGLKTFTGLAHRCQWVRNIAGVDWINDSKGTNVGASVAAIQGIASTCKGRLILLAGGQGKDADFEPLANETTRSCDKVFVYGEDADKLIAVLSPRVAERVADLDEAIQAAHRSAKENDIVLLSPACASFDMFKNFEQRGEYFSEKVNQLRE